MPDNNDYDLSSVDFSEFGGEPSVTPTSEPEPTPAYDLSGVDFSDFVTPEAPEEPGEPGYLSNVARATGERAAELGGHLSTFAIDRFAESVQRNPMVNLYNFISDEPVDVKDNPVYDTAMRGANYLKEVELGYEPRYTWERLKEDTTLLNAAGYVGETGFQSLPDMLAAVNLYTLPVYMAARSQEIGEERAEFKGKDKAELIDVIEASPFAITSSLFERIGGKAVLSELPVDTLKDLVKEVGKATLKEGGTEAIQEGVIEYAGARVGTGADMSLAEAGEQALAASVAGGGFGGAVRGTTGTGQLALGEKKPTDQEAVDFIQNAPDIDTAIKIAEDVADDTEFDTDPIVEPGVEETFDIDEQLIEAPEDVLPQTLAPKDRGYFESEQEANQFKEQSMQRDDDPRRQAEMATMQPVERVPGQWILEKKAPEEVAPEAEPEVKEEVVEPKVGETMKVYEPDGSSYQAEVIEVNEQGQAVVEDKDGIQQIVDSPDTILTSTEPAARPQLEEQLQLQGLPEVTPDLTPVGKDATVLPKVDRRKLRYHKKAALSKTSKGKFAQPFEHKIQQFREGAQKYIDYIPEEQRDQFMADLEPGHIVDPVTGFNRAEERDDTMERLYEHLEANPEMGDRAIYVEADIANLGGLNNELGTSGANIPFKAMVDIMFNELDAVGANIPDFDITPIRHGGDEVSFIMLGAQKKDVDAAIKRAEAKIQDYVKSQGLDTLTHAKTKQENYGTGMVGASGVIDNSLEDFGDNYKKADKIVELRKEEIKEERAKEQEAKDDEQRKEDGEDQRVQYEVRPTERQPGDTPRPREVRAATDRKGEKAPRPEREKPTLEDIKPRAKDVYATRDEAYRAKKQKIAQAKKAGDTELTAALEDYHATPEGDGYVLRHKSKLPKLPKKPKLVEKKIGKIEQNPLFPKIKSQLDDNNQVVGNDLQGMLTFWKNNLKSKTGEKVEGYTLEDVTNLENWITEQKNKYKAKQKAKFDKIRKERAELKPVEKKKVEKKPEPKKEPKKKALPKGHVKRLETVMGEGNVKQVSKAKAKLDKSILSFVEDTLDKKVIFFESTNPLAPNGMIFPQDPNTVYINTKTKKPHVAILGHELLHSLRRDNPEIYNDLKTALEKQLKDYSKYKDNVNRYREILEADPLDNDKIVEELIADMVGDNFTDAEFWANLDVSESKLKKILDAIRKWVNDFYNKAEATLDGTNYFDDYADARAAVSQAFSKYQKEKVEPTEKKEYDSLFDDDVKLSAVELTDSIKNRTWYHGAGAELKGVMEPPLFLTTDVEGVDFYTQGEAPVIYPYEADVKKTYNANTKEGAQNLIKLAKNQGYNLDIRETRYGWELSDPDNIVSKISGGDNVLDVLYLPKVREALIKQGYDSVSAQDVLGNNFIDTLVVIKEGVLKPRYSEGYFSAPEKITPTKAEGLKGRVEDFQRLIIDSYQPIRKVQKEIEKTGKKLSDMFNIDQALTLFPGSTRAEITDFENQQQKPLLELIDKTGLKWDEIAEYLHARHAKEANAVLKERNPNRPDNESLSGMSDENAAKVLKKYQDRPDVKAVGFMVDRMNKERVDYMIKEGLLSKEEANAWRENYKHYIPLHREDIDGAGLPKRGQGFDVRGKASKVRAGSSRAVDYDNMLAHILAQHQTFIVRANKNKVSKTLWNLAKDNPDPDLWLTNREQFPQNIKTLLKSGEIASSVNLQELGVISHKVNGQDRYLYLNPDNPLARDMAKAIKNMNKGTDSRLVRALSQYNRYLSMIVTSWSPEFIISNFARDIQTAAYNLTDTELKGFTKETIKNVPKSMVGIRQSLRGDSTTKEAQLFEQFRRDGGVTGWMQSYDQIEDFMKEIDREVKGWSVRGKRVPGRKQIQKVFKFVDDYNTIVENAVRFSAYKQAILPKEQGGAGLTRKQAAKIAKELTVDFNRKGEIGTTMNALYLFFNAGVQGSARLLRAATNPKNKKLHAMMLATVAASATLDIVNRLVSQGDEDEESGYDKIREQEGQRNLIIMTGPKDYIKVPLPWGYNVLHILGQSVGGAISNSMGTYPQFSLGEEGMRMLLGTMDAFNPLQEGTLTQTISPTIADPYIRIKENVDWHGGPLYPNFNPQAPNYTKFFGTAREESVEIAKWLAEATLNVDTQDSLIDLSPEWLDMGWDFATGGLGRFVADSENLARNIISGEDFETKEVPFVRKVKGEVGPSAQKSSFYDKMYDIINMSVELDRRKKSGDMKGYVAMRKAIKPERLQLVEPAKAARRDIERFKKRIRKLEQAGKKDLVEKQEQLMLNRMKMYNNLYQRKLYGDKNLNP